MIQGVVQKICSCQGHSEDHIIEIWLLQSSELLLFLQLNVVLLDITYKRLDFSIQGKGDRKG